MHLTTFACRAYHAIERLQPLDFLPPLLLRLYLAPIFIEAGANKLDLPSLLPNPGTVQWFEQGLELPLPWLMAALAGWAEFFGGILLLVGLLTRWISIPLLVTMLVAAITVHWQNGWSAIAASSGFFATERSIAATERLEFIRSVLQDEYNYSWLTEHGRLVMLNNGIEFAATYAIMLLVLLFIGGGRYVSLDYWLFRSCRND